MKRLLSVAVMACMTLLIAGCASLLVSVSYSSKLSNSHFFGPMVADAWAALDLPHQ